jgi:hypothetical protein
MNVERYYRPGWVAAAAAVFLLFLLLELLR